MRKSLLFIPGPVAVSEPVLAAMAKPLINHRGPEYARLLHSIAERMQSIFATTGDVLLLGSSGTGSLEAAVTNMFGPGDTLLACPTGVFGERIATIAKKWGCTVEVLETPWGAGVDPEALAARLRADRENKITGILLTHNETSTAVQIDLSAMSRAIGDHPAYVVVDSVSGLGASEFKMDEWKLDIVCAASQKALACPPGLAMVAVSARAWKKIKANKAPRFYFDLQKHKEFFDKGEPPWTPPVSVAFALDVAIDLYEREGPRNVWARHARYTDALHQAIKALGMQIFSRDGVHSVTVTGIVTPQPRQQNGVDEAARRAWRRDLRWTGQDGREDVALGDDGGRLRGRHRRRARGLRNRHPADGLPVQGRGRRERGARRLRQDRQEGASIGSGFIASLTGGAAT